MTMKKRFLSLALAAMVAVPATSAYAATLTGSDTQPLTQSVTVSGSVSTSQGIAPEGKIEVELPTALSFSVDKNGTLQGSEYQVTNRSSKAVVVSVESFTDTTPTEGAGINVKQTSQITQESKRSDVALKLVGRPVLNSGATTEVDLSAINSGGDDILEVAPNGKSGVINLTGIAGTNANNDVDTNGVSDTFNLVFNVRARS